jgi:SAM-dependent methyltransferase
MKSNPLVSFKAALKKIGTNTLRLSGYQLSYFEHLLNNLDHYSSIYALCLTKAGRKVNRDLADSTFLDYGCGNGLLGIYAKYCGYGNVICCDYDRSSIEATSILNEALGNKVDHIVLGEINTLNEYCLNNHLVPDVVVGTDVIEHVYDLDDFFKGLSALNPAQVNVFTTASNPSNPFKVKQLIRLQLRDELEGGYRTNADGSIDPNCFEEPYIKTRAKIIASTSSRLSSDEVELLARATRGKMKSDIQTAVRLYEVAKILPAADEHPYNTCDPITGSWTERILPFESYINLYSKYGFNLEVSNGFYNYHNIGLFKSVFSRGVNLLLRLPGGITRAIAPFVVFTGWGSSKHKND